MRRIVPPAEYMAEAVVDSHSRPREHQPREHRRLEQVVAVREVILSRESLWEMLDEQGRRADGHGPLFVSCVIRVQALDTMGEGVDSGTRGQIGWSVNRQLGIVEHQSKPDSGITDDLLAPVGGR